MRNPNRLEVVEVAARLAELTYGFTRSLPADERFGLGAQMRRAGISVGSNIVEGCGYGTEPNFIRFVGIAVGSLMELDYQAMLAQRLSLGDATQLAALRAHAHRLKKMLGSLRRVVRSRAGEHQPSR